jgi:hypothetical protein
VLIIPLQNEVTNGTISSILLVDPPVNVIVATIESSFIIIRTTIRVISTVIVELLNPRVWVWFSLWQGNILIFGVFGVLEKAIFGLLGEERRCWSTVLFEEVV